MISKNLESCEGTARSCSGRSKLSRHRLMTQPGQLLAAPHEDNAIRAVHAALKRFRHSEDFRPGHLGCPSGHQLGPGGDWRNWKCRCHPIHGCNRRDPDCCCASADACSGEWCGYLGVFLQVLLRVAGDPGFPNRFFNDSWVVGSWRPTRAARDWIGCRNWNPG
jgi:hypothetical protein